MKSDTRSLVRHRGSSRNIAPSRKDATQRNVGRVVLSALFALVLTVACTHNRRGAEFRNSLQSFTEHLDERIPPLMDQYDVPGVSIALIHKGKAVWLNAYGYADPEHRRKMTVDAVYRVESISKSVTAWGVMRLVEQGLVDLDAPVQQYLGDWKFPESEYSESKVTIRRLLSHNAGMPLGTIGVKVEYPPQGNTPTLQDFLTSEARLFNEPGSGFLYSDTGFNLLELLIEEVTGRDFAEYMTNEVLIPLGMRDSSFAWDERRRPSIPIGYDLKGKSVPVYVYPAKASGGLFATVEDIARFVSAEMTGSHYTARRPLSQEGIRILHSPQVDIPGIYGIVSDSYGLGHFIENLPDGRQAIWHGGQGHGWMSHFHLVPESGDGIVILTNSQRSWPLMAQVLSDWAKWNGIGLVKMGRITYGIAIMRVLTSLVALAALWQAVRLIQGLQSRDRTFAPLSRNSRIARLLQAMLGLNVIAALAWYAAQPYLIVSSIFPGIAGWTGISFFGMSVVMILSALFPHSDVRSHEAKEHGYKFNRR